MKDPGAETRAKREAVNLGGCGVIRKRWGPTLSASRLRGRVGDGVYPHGKPPRWREPDPLGSLSVDPPQAGEVNAPAAPAPIQFVRVMRTGGAGSIGLCAPKKANSA